MSIMESTEVLAKRVGKMLPSGWVVEANHAFAGSVFAAQGYSFVIGAPKLNKAMGINLGRHMPHPVLVARQAKQVIKRLSL